jgi:tripartite-type tricarboxylate transporter receptor subunit TctC
MGTLTRRTLLTSSVCALAAGPGRLLAASDNSWPTRPVTMIVAFAPGGFTDVAARLIANQIGTDLGQSVIVENRAGAAGLIGTQTAARATPDGYTLLLGTISTHAINVGLYKSLPYDPVKDFVPVSGVASGPLVLVVNPAMGVKTVAELIDKARAAPGKYTYGSGGPGTTSHLAAEMFKSMAKIDLLHVPYRSPALATSGLLGDQVDLMFDTVPATINNVKAGKIIALGITGAPGAGKIVDMNLPDISATLPGYSANTWVGMFLPAGASPAIVERLDASIRKALADPAMVKRLAEIGMLPFVCPPREFAEYIKTDTRRWTDLIHKNGISMD